VGYFQKLEKEIDQEACAGLGLDIVRRPTGGKMVLHDRELTYSVILKQGRENFPDDIMGAYLFISQALMEGLKGLNVRAEMAHVDRREKKGAGPHSAACFSAISSLEITAGGKKLVGSAQRRTRDGVIQHGSILIDLDLDKLMAVQKFNRPEQNHRMRDLLARRMTGVNDLIPAAVDFDDVAAAMRAGFMTRFDDPMVEGRLSKREEDLTAELREKKYRSERWTVKREYQPIA
jgi:lipoate-protein ligase A